ncbi:NAD-dependent succinate-semialdehyde dehydrogenase [Phenylobacterium aquaticum]|uniref:NAD-dependent succinate-semialdehyde dehydrogenase n=1 Tax=Phenylobacterium aquaticum TaxID=1763816 RepID=UPI0026F23CA6|nr:NAD-dependent succinate-semialdehyde dehydrogenase [Phenylobacterium aquaticum]
MTLQPASTCTFRLLDGFQRRDLLLEDALIGGAWIGAQDDARFAVTNPADGARLAQVADCGPAEAIAALDAAVKAGPAWRRTTPQARRQILKRWHGLLMANQDDLARLISLEQGKPLAEAAGEVAYGAAYVDWFADEAIRGDGEILASPALDRQMTAVREPIGVVAVVTPWNFPIAMIARKIAPALAAGCTVVGKPAEDTPLSALAIARLAQEAGVPDGVLNMLPASRLRGAALVGVWLDEECVRKLSFTGSTATGKFLAERSAPTLKRLSLELGGNAPFLVFDDADLDVAIRGALAAKFRNAGQTCVSPNRFLVQAGVHDAFVARLADAAASLKVGTADEAGVQIGPLINDKAVQKVEAHIQDAIARGARVVQGGARHPLGGSFFQPTVLVGMDPDMRASCEETFGPVVSVTRFETEAEAVTLANATPFGLAAYLFTADRKRIARVGAALESGMVGVNEGAISSEVAPFGGVKQSGYGREGSRHGLIEYQTLKYICEGGLD